MLVFILSLAAAAGALLGGLAAFKSKRQIGLALGFTAGAILGLVAFDLLPEVFKTVGSTGLNPIWPMIALVFGFLAFHIVEKLILVHHAHSGDYAPHRHPYVGMASAVALAGHSFLDGVAIGVAYQVSAAVGTAVTIAVVSHRFADGFNTTNLMLYHQNKPKRARQMLYIAAAMPILGALSTNLISFSDKSLAIYLGFFAGFLLYISASDILPQAHSKAGSRAAIGLTVLGVLFMYAVTQAI